MGDDGVDILDNTTFEVWSTTATGRWVAGVPTRMRTEWWPAPATASTPPTVPLRTGGCRCRRDHGSAPWSGTST